MTKYKHNWVALFLCEIFFKFNKTQGKVHPNQVPDCRPALSGEDLDVC